MYKLNKIQSKGTIFTVYIALYKSIIQYGLIVWGDCSENAIRSLITQKYLAVRVWLDKNVSIGSSVSKYKELSVKPVRLLYKQFSILTTTC
jgi:hypothetical protein